MSKSKGNVLDPLDIVDGIDLEALVAKRTTGLMQPQLAPAIEHATRKQFPRGHRPPTARTRCASPSPRSRRSRRDLRFDLGRVEGYRNFCNKLWNAARFVLMSRPRRRWRRARRRSRRTTAGSARGCAATIAAVREGFAQYRFDLAAQAVYEFTWYEFCDWYLELSKPVLQSGESSDAARARGTRARCSRRWRRCCACCIR